MRDYSRVFIGNVYVKDRIPKKQKKVTYSCYCYVCNSESYVFQTDLTAGIEMCSECKKQLKRNLAAYSTKSKGYVYGIYHKFDLLYVGITNDVSQRFQEHKDNIKNSQNNSNQERTLYRYLRDYPFEELEFRVLESYNNITRKALEKREKLWIDNFSPLYNYDGIARPYHSSVADVPIEAIKIFETAPTRFVNKAYRSSKQKAIIKKYMEGLDALKKDRENEQITKPISLPLPDDKAFQHVGHYYKK